MIMDWIVSFQNSYAEAPVPPPPPLPQNVTGFGAFKKLSSVKLLGKALIQSD